MENWLIQELIKANFDSLIPKSKPPEDPMELLIVQLLIELLNESSSLEVKDSFLVSWIQTMSICLTERESLRNLLLLGEPNPLAFQQKMLIMRN